MGRWAESRRESLLEGVRRSHAIDNKPMSCNRTCPKHVPLTIARFVAQTKVLLACLACLRNSEAMLVRIIVMTIGKEEMSTQRCRARPKVLIRSVASQTYTTSSPTSLLPPTRITTSDLQHITINNMHFSQSTIAAIALAVARSMADTCELSAVNDVASTIEGPGGVGAGNSFDNGFYLSVNGGDKTKLKPNDGNGFPPNYACPDGGAGLYGYARFTGTEKGDLGMCTKASGEDDLPGLKFDCEDLAGKVSQHAVSQPCVSSSGLLTTMSVPCRSSKEQQALPLRASPARRDLTARSRSTADCTRCAGGDTRFGREEYFVETQWQNLCL
jgi:hypothetical protein